MRSYITEVTLLAKQKYCYYARPQWTPIIEKVQCREKLEPSEVISYDKIEKEILDIVNHRASLLTGLTKNNKKQARFLYRDLLFIVKFHKGVGKVITIKFGSICIDNKGRDRRSF